MNAETETIAGGGALSGHKLRRDLEIIAQLIKPKARLLDVGCSDGTLLEYLWRTSAVDGRGIEISHDGVRTCVAKGLSVIQGDANTDLADYPSQAFDYVVLSQTLQTVREPRRVLDHLVRIGKQAIVSFPNFGYWRVRLALLLDGRMPVTNGLPLQWYETPNIHFCTIRDFCTLCAEMGIDIRHSVMMRRDERAVTGVPHGRANLIAEQAIFLLERRK